MSCSIIYGTMNERDVVACDEFERPANSLHPHLKSLLVKAVHRQVLQYFIELIWLPCHVLAAG